MPQSRRGKGPPGKTLKRDPEQETGFWYSLLTLCGLTGQKTHRGDLGFGRSIHEEAHRCFPHFFFKKNFKALMLEAPTAC